MISGTRRKSYYGGFCGLYNYNVVRLILRRNAPLDEKLQVFQVLWVSVGKYMNNQCFAVCR